MVGSTKHITNLSNFSKARPSTQTTIGNIKKPSKVKKTRNQPLDSSQMIEAKKNLKNQLTHSSWHWSFA